MSANGSLRGDFEQLGPGDGFETRGRTIGEADLVGFSALTGDWHPQHSDAEWAQRSPFGARVAHGMLLLSYAVGLAPIDPERVVALRGLDRVVFKRPVLIGDTIRVVGRVEATKPLDAEHGLVEMAWRLLNQRDELVARARVTALWRRAAVAAPDRARPPAAEPPFPEVYL